MRWHANYFIVRCEFNTNVDSKTKKHVDWSEHVIRERVCERGCLVFETGQNRATRETYPALLKNDNRRPENGTTLSRSQLTTLKLMRSIRGRESN